jgi:hypothetical protein
MCFVARFHFLYVGIVHKRVFSTEEFNWMELRVVRPCTAERSSDSFLTSFTPSFLPSLLPSFLPLCPFTSSFLPSSLPTCPPAHIPTFWPTSIYTHHQPTQSSWPRRAAGQLFSHYQRGRLLVLFLLGVQWPFFYSEYSRPFTTPWYWAPVKEIMGIFMI